MIEELSVDTELRNILQDILKIMYICISFLKLTLYNMPFLFPGFKIIIYNIEPIEYFSDSNYQIKYTVTHSQYILRKLRVNNTILTKTCSIVLCIKTVHI